MSKLHVLDAHGRHYTVVLHTDTPTGNNLAGKAWVNIQASLGTQTAMTIGTGPGQISQAEADSIAAGTILEIRESVLLESGGMSLDSINEMVDQIILTEKKKLQDRYDYYGYTLG